MHTSHCALMNEGLKEHHKHCICDAQRPFDAFDETMNQARMSSKDEVNYPSHYTMHPTGVECIEIAETMTFNLGNALKYIWRAGLKSNDWEKDLKKAVWYIQREIGRLQKLHGQDNQPKEHGAARTPTENGVGPAPGELTARYHSGG